MADNAATMARLLAKVKNLTHACEQEWQVKNKKIILICFDGEDEFSKTIEDVKIQLHNIHDSVVFLADLPSCMTFIQSNEENKLFLLTTDSSVDEIVRRASEWNQLAGIFILNLRKGQQDSIAHECSKVTSIDDDFQSLCASIAREIDLADQLLPTWCFFDQDTWAKRDLYKYPSSFLWLQLLHDVLLYLPRDESAKKQTINTFRQYYRENIKALQSIDEFEDKYQSNEAVRQYLNNSFLRKMISKALRTENTDQIYRLRYFLRDLLDGIPHMVRSTSKKMFVYRAMHMCHEEFGKLRNNQYQLMAMKGFLVAARSRSEALAMIDRVSPSSDLNAILFEIECREPAMARSNQEQILFDMNTTFRLDSIGKKGAYWQIRMSVVDDGQIIKQKYIDDVHRQTEEVTIPILFGRYLCDMSHWDQSQLYFEHLFSQPYGEDLAWIMHGLGRAHRSKSQWLEARKYHD